MDREIIVLLDENILREFFRRGRKTKEEKEGNVWRRKRREMFGEGKGG